MTLYLFNSSREAAHRVRRETEEEVTRCQEALTEKMAEMEALREAAAKEALNGTGRCLFNWFIRFVLY